MVWLTSLPSWMVSWYPRDPGGDGFVCAPAPPQALQAAFLWSVTVITPQEIPFPRAFPCVTGIYLHTRKSVCSGCTVWGIFPQVLAESSVWRRSWVNAPRKRSSPSWVTLLTSIALKGLCDFLLSHFCRVLNSSTSSFSRTWKLKISPVTLDDLQQMKVGNKQCSWPNLCCRAEKDVLLKSGRGRMEINENSFGWQIMFSLKSIQYICSYFSSPLIRYFLSTERKDM